MRRSIAAAFLVVAYMVLTASSAGAHALVRSSDPADGAILDHAPAQVSITFTERPDAALSVIRVLDAQGREVQTGKAEPVPGQPLQLSVGLGSLGKGVYTVTWRIVSMVDGHVTAGSFSFGVGVSPPPSTGSETGPGTPSPSPLAAAGRCGLYAGLAMLVAAGPFWLVAFREAKPSLRVLAVSLGLAMVGLAAVIVAERSTVGVSFSQLLRSSTGHALVWQGLGLLLAGLTVLWLGVGRSKRAIVAVTVAAAGTMLLHARAGHAAASGHVSWFDVLVQWIHLMAVGVWIGGLAWLLFTRRMRQADLAPRVKRFSTLAGVALAVVAVSGVQRAISEVGGPTAWGRLFHTSFGVTLLLKVGLFVVLVALGARNRYVNVPAVARDMARMSSLRRTVAGEMAIAAGILGVTGVLTQFPPPASVAASHASAASHEHVVVTGSDFATTVRVRLTVMPATVGPNLFEARVTDYDTGQPVPATSVSLGFALPGRPEIGTPQLALDRVAPGVWTGRGTVLSLDGRWDVTVLIQEASDSVTVPLTLQTRLPPQQIQVLPGANGQPTIYTITLAGGVTVQTYVDPGTPGNNVVHFTFFQANGQELPIASASALATPPGGAAADLPLVRFDPGHFVANTTLTSGAWRFQVTATAQDGATYSAYFDHTIP